MFNILFLNYFKENNTLTERELENRFYNLY